VRERRKRSHEGTESQHKLQSMHETSLTDGCMRSKGSTLQFDLRDAPTTRYQGSKRKILPWLWRHLEPLNFKSALDVFGGTGSVSYMLKRMGKAVTYNDHMRWNFLVGTALIQNDECKLTENEIIELTRPTSGLKGEFVSRTFPKMYFTRQENIWIDTLVTRIKKMPASSQDQKYKVALAYYCLFQTCLVKRPFNLFHRANLAIRLSDVNRSFGNKTTWETPFAKHFRAFADEVNSFVFQGMYSCRALNYNADDIPQNNYDLVYLDPPYVKCGARNETADYHKCYHFLEGLARYDEWPLLIDYSTRLLQIKAPGKTRWSKPDNNGPAFEELFEKFPNSTFAISYKKFGCPSIDTLVRMLKRRGKTVRVHTKHYKYALNQQNGSAELNRECLIIAE
jgi:adenine-specific DNA methylase